MASSILSIEQAYRLLRERGVPTGWTEEEWRRVRGLLPSPDGEFSCCDGLLCEP